MVEQVEAAGYQFALFDAPRGTEADAGQRTMSRLLLLLGVVAVGLGTAWYIVQRNEKEVAK